MNHIPHMNSRYGKASRQMTKPNFFKPETNNETNFRAFEAQLK